MFGIGPIELLVLSVIGLPIYVLPTIIAVIQNHPKAAPIALVNLLLGWTCIGYVVALVWSVTGGEPPDSTDQ